MNELDIVVRVLFAFVEGGLVVMAGVVVLTKILAWLDTNAELTLDDGS